MTRDCSLAFTKQLNRSNVLDGLVAQMAKADAAKKTTRKRKRNTSPTLQIKEIVEEEPHTEDSNSGESYISIALRR